MAAKPEHTIAALDLRQQLFEREGGWGAAEPIADDAEMHPRVTPVFPLRDIFREDRRSVIDRRVYCAVLRFGVAPEMG